MIDDGAAHRSYGMICFVWFVKVSSTVFPLSSVLMIHVVVSHHKLYTCQLWWHTHFLCGLFTFFWLWLFVVSSILQGSYLSVFDSNSWGCNTIGFLHMAFTVGHHYQDGLAPFCGWWMILCPKLLPLHLVVSVDGGAFAMLYVFCT